MSGSSAPTVSQPRSSTGSLAMLGSAALSEGLPAKRGSSPELPLANTTMPPRLTTKSFHAFASSVDSAGSFQYRPPQELLMMRAPAFASSALIAWKNSP